MLWAVAFLLLLVLNTTHINKKNKKGQNTITKGRAYSTVETQNQKVLFNFGPEVICAAQEQIS